MREGWGGVREGWGRVMEGLLTACTHETQRLYM